MTSHRIKLPIGVYYWHLSIFESELWLVVQKTMKEAILKATDESMSFELNDDRRSHINSSNPPLGYCMFSMEKGHFAIVLPSITDIPTLSHEVLHITNRILHRIGVHPCFVNDETQAYLFSHILENILAIKTP